MTAPPATTPRPFQQIDVFTAVPGNGNPLAVVLEGTGLDDARMQRFAHWTNLSETTFLLPPTDRAADYRVRIFTPGAELPFAGHPTLGSCHAWLAAGGRPKSPGRIVQECGVGLVTLRREAVDGVAGPGRLAFAAPPLARSAPSPTLLAKVARALGLEAHRLVAAQLLDNGPVWLGLLLDGADTVLALQPDHRALKALGVKVGVAGLREARVDADSEMDAHADAVPTLVRRSNREARAFAGVAGVAATGGTAPGARAAGATAAQRPALEVRAFVAPVGVDEDPVTGSLNASLAQWLVAEGHLPARYVAAQGQCLGRDGRVHVARDADGQVWIGGDAVTRIDGRVHL
ncbi:MAG TPA: PhzF family phenazine biosynthesis protein [Variovorax sp.]|nr:PhzF family phenazine biosynthesis protein [Variovorax sp.]